MSNDIKVYKVALFQCASPCILKSLDEVLEHLRDNLDNDEMTPGEVVTIEVKTMSAAELEDLPEWDGP